MLIGLTTTLSEDLASERITIEYAECVRQAGGTPVFIPSSDEGDIPELLAPLQGVVLTGGGDVDPSLYYDSTLLEKTTGVSAQRDRFEIALTRKAFDLDLPFLGVCRGMQIMNVAFGGSLYQDVISCKISKRTHDQGQPYDALSHTVSIKPKTQLAHILSGFPLDAYPVNSLHHQAIKVLAPDLQLTAWSEEGIIEALESSSRSFFLGVQWHPEYLASGQVLFDALCAAARKYSPAQG